MLSIPFSLLCIVVFFIFTFLSFAILLKMRAFRPGAMDFFSKIQEEPNGKELCLPAKQLHELFKRPIVYKHFTSVEEIYANVVRAFESMLMCDTEAATWWAIMEACDFCDPKFGFLDTVYCTGFSAKLNGTSVDATYMENYVHDDFKSIYQRWTKSHQQLKITMSDIKKYSESIPRFLRHEHNFNRVVDFLVDECEEDPEDMRYVMDVIRSDHVFGPKPTILEGEQGINSAEVARREAVSAAASEVIQACRNPSSSSNRPITKNSNDDLNKRIALEGTSVENNREDINDGESTTEATSIATEDSQTSSSEKESNKRDGQKIVAKHAKNYSFWSHTRVPGMNEKTAAVVNQTPVQVLDDKEAHIRAILLEEKLERKRRVNTTRSATSTKKSIRKTKQGKLNQKVQLMG
mmetsp:Transcript_40816/g.46939  ORF Transcript_40816/g.46939 Transcript_40816/m.46939 type:complete len:407 (-) Transcript_40816:787-2007(-)